MRFFKFYVVLIAFLLCVPSANASSEPVIDDAQKLQETIFSDTFLYLPLKERVDVIEQYFLREQELPSKVIPYRALATVAGTLIYIGNPDTAVAYLESLTVEYDERRGSVEEYMHALMQAIHCFIRLEHYDMTFDLLFLASQYENYAGGRYYSTLRTFTDFHLSYNRGDYQSTLDAFNLFIGTPGSLETWDEFGHPLHFLYNDAGVAALKLNKPVEAVKIIKEGQDIQKKVAAKVPGSTTFGISIGLARAYSALGDHDRAEKLVFENLDAAKKSGRWFFTSQAIQVLAEAQIARSNPERALELLNEAWALGEGKINLDREISLQNSFAKAYQQAGNYKKAFEALRMLTDIDRAAKAAQLNINIAIGDANRKLEDQAQEISFIKREHDSATQLLEREKNIRLLMLVSSALLGILLIAITFTYFLQRKARKKLEIFADELVISKSEVQKASEAKSLFLASMSHEIRTPMNGVLGMAQLLSQTPLDEKQTLYLDTISSSGTALLSIINDILDFSKVEAGKIELNPINFDIEQAVSEIVALLSGSAKSKGIDLRVNLDQCNPKWFSADVNRIKQILLNVIGNAIKFTEEGHVEIEVAAEPSGTDEFRLKINVSDTGIGIKKEQIANLFDPFVQADASTTRKFGGTGLGLSISKKLANLLGGDFTIKSEYGVGTEALIEITASKGEREQETKTAFSTLFSVEQEATSNFQTKVLLAEDNEVNQMVVRHMLNNRDVVLTIVGDGEEAVDAYKNGDFDLILMDVTMPKLDGVGATKKIRSLEKAENESPIPIFALTAHAFKEEQDRCLSSGMDGFLTKPVKQEVLFEVLDSVR